MQAQLELFDVPPAENTGFAHCVCGNNFRGAYCPYCKRERYCSTPADWPDGIPPSLWSPGALAAHKAGLPPGPPRACADCARPMPHYVDVCSYCRGEATVIGGGCGAKGHREELEAPDPRCSCGHHQGRHAWEGTLSCQAPGCECCEFRPASEAVAA